MKPFTDYLSESDKGHVEKILQHSDEVQGPDSVERINKFLGLWVMVDPASGRMFQALDEAERQQLLSELIWRITCVVQGSVTSVMGVASFDVGFGFRANKMDENGQDVLILVGSSKS